MPRTIRRPSFGRRGRQPEHVRLYEGNHGPLYDPETPGVELEGAGSFDALGSLEAVGPRLDSLLSEQATLTEIMKGFDQQLQAGVDGDALLTSREFQHALTRLSAAQRELSSCLGLAREQIVRDYSMLLTQSRALLELLSTVTARANGEMQPAPSSSTALHSSGDGMGGGVGGGELFFPPASSFSAPGGAGINSSDRWSAPDPRMV